jgi:site-specific DNA-methyltransferase (adenine-specific)
VAELVHRTDLAEVWHGHAEDVLPEIGTESVDLVIADPPYGVEWQSGRRARLFDPIAFDSPEDRAGIRDVLAETVRTVGQHRHLYVFGPADVLDGLKVTCPVELVWDKDRPGMGDLAAPWGPQHEPVQFVVSKHRHGGEAGDTTAVAARMRKGSVLRFPARTGRTVRHPSEKPLALLRELVESSSRVGDLVLDPFGGVLSTAVAAILCGRRAVTVELDARYVSVGVERVRAAERLAVEAANL